MSSRSSKDLPLCGSRGVAGFSLVEVMVTVVIITIIAAIALPTLRKGMRDRRTRQMAEEVARVFRDARLRAMARGSAVMVHYNKNTKSFDVREAVTGRLASQPATCARLPASSCQLANFTATGTPNVLRGSQPIENLTVDTVSETTGLKLKLELPVEGSPDDFSVCFTPLGRAYSSVTWPPNFSTLLSEVPLIRVYRTEPGDTAQVGLERRVVVLPNGQARLQTAGAP